MAINSKNQKKLWKNHILQQQSSGNTIVGWCRENNIHPRSFYYWRVKIFPKKIDRLNFIELKNTKTLSIKSNSILIKYHGAEISVEKDFDITLLQNCLKALRGVQCL